jgi:predicted transcriptional regulator
LIVLIIRVRYDIKEQVSEALKIMPERFDVEDIIERLILLDKIQQGLDDIEHSKVYTKEEVMKKVERWLK